MRICVVCRFDEVWLDDVAILFARDRCVCVACFARAVGDEHHPSKALIRAVTLPEETLLTTKLPPDSRMTQHSERPM